MVEGLGLLLVTGLPCLLDGLLLLICPCHIRMPDDLLGPTMPDLPCFPLDVGDGRLVELW